MINPALNIRTPGTPEGGYPIYIRGGGLAALPALLSAHRLTQRAALITNTTLLRQYGEALSALLPDVLIVPLPDGEQYKTLETLVPCFEQLAEAGLDRGAAIIAFGGGVVGDMAGFVAASFLRGVRFVQVPTSLLAMVDSSVGGKVGVDLRAGKNLVGAFKQPEFVLIDPDLLSTLPDAEWRCGVAETIKAGLLRDAALLDPALYNRDQYPFPGAEIDFIGRAVQIKADVVEKDPYEQDIRAHLNLGHTFGHALEIASNFTWRHGEAVGWGVVAAAHLSHAHGLCDAALLDQVERVVGAVGLPIRAPGFAPEQIRAVMGTDKKRRAGQLRFVLLRAVGDPTLHDDVPEAQLMDILRRMCRA